MSFAEGLFYLYTLAFRNHTGIMRIGCILVISQLCLAQVLIGVVTASAVSAMCDGGRVAFRGEGRRVGWGDGGVRWTR